MTVEITVVLVEAEDHRTDREEEGNRNMVVVAVVAVVIAGEDMERHRTVQMVGIKIIERMDAISRSTRIVVVVLEEDDAGDTDRGITTRRRRRRRVQRAKEAETRMEIIRF